MQSAGYRIIPVNPKETEVLGEKSYAALDEIPGHIDIVNIFRRSEFVPDLVDAAIRIERSASGCRKASSTKKPPRKPVPPASKSSWTDAF